MFDAGMDAELNQNVSILLGFGFMTLSGPAEGTRQMSNERFASVWDAIENTPAEAENMKLRSTLMMALEQHIRTKGWTQAEAARQLGVTQPRVSDLLRGKINLFALDTLVNMLVAVGLHVEVSVREAA
jgi:predicted XRE-type DNA-binding protein